MVVVYDYSSTIRMTINPASPFCAAVSEAISFQCLDDFSNRSVTKLLGEIEWKH